MTPEPLIRAETDADTGAIRDVTGAAFGPLAVSPHSEQFVTEALRAAGALTVSRVAALDGRIVGHMAFFPR
jgi:putative acetyltransferase